MDAAGDDDAQATRSGKTFAPGTQSWWDGVSIHGARGIVDAILVLLEREQITRAKARELLLLATGVPRAKIVPLAPWDLVEWGGYDG